MKPGFEILSMNGESAMTHLAVATQRYAELAAVHFER
jgi:hypothetical protein